VGKGTASIRRFHVNPVKVLLNLLISRVCAFCAKKLSTQGLQGVQRKQDLRASSAIAFCTEGSHIKGLASSKCAKTSHRPSVFQAKINQAENAAAEIISRMGATKN
jgi:hypothetical protein